MKDGRGRRTGTPCVRTIAGKEIAANLLSYKFFVVILLSSVLVGVSLAVMYRDFKGRLADYELNRPKAGEAAALLAPNPLSIFARGLDEPMTRSFQPGVTGISVLSGQSSGNIIFSFFPAPDFLYVIRVVMSLVALLFGFDQVSRERERGTLRLMLANPVSRSAVLAGKWLGNFLSLALPFLIVTLLGIVLLGLDPAVKLSGAVLGRLMLIIVISLVYMALFLSLGLLVSAGVRKSSASLIVLLFIWIGLVFILPNLGTLLARQFTSVPSVRALGEKKTQLWVKEVFLSMADRSTRAAGMDRLNLELDRMEEDYRNKFDGMVRTAKNMNRISPAASLVYVVTDLAGTGMDEEGRLKKEIIRYKNQVLECIRKEGKTFPSFTYRYRTVGEIMDSSGSADIGWLIIGCVVVFFAAFMVLARSDVR